MVSQGPTFVSSIRCIFRNRPNLPSQGVPRLTDQSPCEAPVDHDHVAVRLQVLHLKGPPQQRCPSRRSSPRRKASDQTSSTRDPGRRMSRIVRIPTMPQPVPNTVRLRRKPNPGWTVAGPHPRDSGNGRPHRVVPATSPIPQLSSQNPIGLASMTSRF